jgi:tetratricopeptide (TPR) repeat protein
MIDGDAFAGPWKELGKDRERRLAGEVVAMGWLSEGKLKECLQSKPPQTPLADYLVREKFISPEQLAEIESAPAYHICPSCFRRYDLQGARAQTRYRCPRCNATLVAQGGEETVPAESLEIATQVLPEEARAAFLEPDNAFDKYIRIRMVGRGGMGSVWRCYDRELKRFVAVKFLEGAGEKTTARFFREAMLAGKLDHPNIAPIYDSGTWRGAPYIVMQFVEGQSPSRALEVREALRIMALVCRAVHYAHENGIIHRDVKPENILISPDGKVTVLDFGLAREIATDSSISASGTVLGTPPYMSPEQIRGETHRVDHRSDVYSLGATLFDVLTDRPPFAGENLQKILREIEEEDPPAPSRFRKELPWEVDAIVLKAMEKDPTRRYPSAEELARDIERHLNGEPILARPSGWAYRLKKKILRHPAASAMLAFFLVAGLFALGVWIGGQLNERKELDRLMEEGGRKFAAGELQGANDAFVRAAQIDPERAASSLTEVREALQKMQLERGRLAVIEEERRRVDPHITALRQIEMTPRSLNFGSRVEQILNASADLTRRHPESPGAWLLSGWSKRLMRRFGGGSSVSGAREDLSRAIALAEAGRPEYVNDAYYQRGMDYVEELFTERIRYSDSAYDVRRFSGLEVPAASGRDLIQKAQSDLGRGRHGETFHIGTAYLESVLLYLGGDGRTALERLKRPDALGSLEELVLQSELEFFVPDFDMIAKLGMQAYAEKAIPELSWIADRSDRHRLHLVLGLVRAAVDDYSKAEASLERAMQIDPRFSTQWLWRGLVRERNQDAEGALADYTAFIEREPGNPDGYVLRAEMRRRAGRLDEAESDCSKALELTPGHLKARVVQGCIWVDRKMHSRAFQEFKEVLEKRPNYPHAVLGRARAHASQGQWDEAVADYGAYLMFDPRCGRTVYERAMVHFRNSKWSLAMQDVQGALICSSRNVEALLLRARLHERLAADYPSAKTMHLRRAEQDLKTAASLDPRHKEWVESELRRIQDGAPSPPGDK